MVKIATLNQAGIALRRRALGVWAKVQAAFLEAPAPVSAPLGKRLIAAAPYMLLGPITGPLTAGVVRNLRKGHPVLAGLYAVAIVEIMVALPLVTTKLTLNLVAASH